MDIASVQAACHMNAVPIAQCMSLDLELQQPCLPQLSFEEIRRDQNVDQILGPWVTAVRTACLPKFSATQNSTKHRIMKFVLKRGVLYR